MKGTEASALVTEVLLDIGGPDFPTSLSRKGVGGHGRDNALNWSSGSCSLSSSGFVMLMLPLGPSPTSQVGRCEKKLGAP